MSAAVTKLPGKPIPVDDIVEGASRTRLAPLVQATIENTTERLFTVYHLKGTSMLSSFILFTKPITIPEAVEFARKYCTTQLNSRFIRIEQTITIVDFD